MMKAKGALIILIILAFSALAAPIVAPYSYKHQFRSYPAAPPMRIHFFLKTDGGYTFRPHVREIQRTPEGYRETGRICNVHLLSRGKLLSCECPCFLLGSDSLGRDILSRIIYGGRISLSIGIVGVCITAVLGLLFGGIAGYFGGLVDMLIMRLTEVLMSLPSFFLLLSLSVVIPPGLSSAQTFLIIVLILSFIGWAGFARVIRGMVASIRTSDHVVASLAMGAGHIRTLIRHVIPLTLGYTVVVMTLNIPAYILGESALSMLGLGIREPDPSWGNMLAEALNISILADRPWTLAPGAFIVLAVIAFNVIGESLRASLVVKEKGQ